MGFIGMGLKIITDNMKLIGYTVVYNEEALVPYVLPYIVRMGYDKFVIFDDGCTDNTIEAISRGLSEHGINFEVRPTVVNNPDYDFDGRKRDSMVAGIHECTAIVNENGGESVWMTFTDFDEVIYCTREREEQLKGYLELMDKRGFNFFDGRMLHLTWDEKEMNEKALPHQWEGVRGAWWLSEGGKVTLFKVNDFASITAFCANHHMGVRMANGKRPKDLSLTGEFQGFHLKYFSKTALDTKPARLYGSSSERLVNEVRFNSFPLDMFFLFNGFCAGRIPADDKYLGEGLFLM